MKANKNIRYKLRHLFNSMISLVLAASQLLILISTVEFSNKIFIQKYPSQIYPLFKLTQIGLAQGRNLLADAQKAFKQGDIVAAKNLLSREMNKFSRSDKESALNLLGICYYLVGQKEEAKDAFTKSLALNPRSTLDKAYVLDPAINSFFAGIQKAGSGQSSQNKQSNRKGSGAQLRSAQSGALPPIRAGATAIYVNANAPGSTVFANGLFVGTAGQVIELSPGRYKLVVSAAGYNPETQNIQLAQGQQLLMNVTLLDPIEIRKRELLAKREQRRKILAAKALDEKMKREQQEKLRAQAEAAAQLRAKQELQREMRARAAEQARKQEIARARAKAESEIRAKAAARQKAEAELAALEREEALEIAKLQQKQNQSTRPQPARRQNNNQNSLNYQSALPRGKRSLADEFKSEQKGSSKTKSPYPQTLPQRQVPVAPIQKPNYGTSNGQTFQTPRQNQPYVAPQPYGQPGSQVGPYPPVQGYGAPPFNGNQPYAPQAPKQSKSTFLAMLPFGIGQFQNDAYFLGASSALLQVGALGFGIYAITQVAAANAAYQAEAEIDPNLPQDYIDENAAYIEEYTLYSQIGFISFGAIWVLSGIEALVSINTSHTVSNTTNSPETDPFQEKKVVSVSPPAITPYSESESTVQKAYTFRPILHFRDEGMPHKIGLQLNIKF